MEAPCVNWLRWAFNCKQWKPIASEWLHANKCIQSEELQRIEQFVFQSPAISSLVGRLMLRKGIQTAMQMSNTDIKLSRTAEGRPFVPGLDVIDINVSHHGDWVVLALERGRQVGIDVMSMDRPVNKDLDEYFRLMRRQFTRQEWVQIEKSPNKLNTFYRFWCLKESYVKATGVGLNLDLQTIDFTTRDELGIATTTNSTTMKLNGKCCKPEWTFEETLLDTNHCVSTCIGSDESAIAIDCDKHFTRVTIDTLLNLETLSEEVAVGLWEKFNSKKYSAHE